MKQRDEMVCQHLNLQKNKNLINTKIQEVILYRLEMIQADIHILMIRVRIAGRILMMKKEITMITNELTVTRELPESFCYNMSNNENIVTLIARKKENWEKTLDVLYPEILYIINE